MDAVREIDLLKICKLLWKRILIIVLVAAIASAVCLVYHLGFAEPVYQASVSVYVNTTTTDVSIGGISSSDLATAQRLVATCVYIMNSNRVLSAAQKEMVWDLSPGEILQMSTSKGVGETECFIISVKHSDPQVAADVANALGAAAVTEIPKVIQGSVLSIIDNANVPAAPTGFSAIQIMLIGAFVGAILTAAAVIVVELLDKRIKEEEELAQFAPLAVLGIIPNFEESGNDRYYSEYSSANRAEV